MISINKSTLITAVTGLAVFDEDEGDCQTKMGMIVPYDSIYPIEPEFKNQP